MNGPAELSYEQCYELLTGAVFGRVAVSSPSGPRIVPVNYSLVNATIVFRTAPYSVLGTYARNSQLAFEVDHVDHVDHVDQVDQQTHRGWSVVATGRGYLVDDLEELAEIRSLADPRPWAGGARLLYIRLRWDELSGRRVGEGWASEAEPASHPV